MNDKAIVEIFPGDLKEREGEFTNDKGEQVKFHTRKQEARLEVGGFAYPYDVRLEDGQKAYAPGRYEMNLARMLTVNKGSHGIARFPVLIPMKG